MAIDAGTTLNAFMFKELGEKTLLTTDLGEPTFMTTGHRLAFSGRSSAR